MWEWLDEGIRHVVTTKGKRVVPLKNEWRVEMQLIKAPHSLMSQVGRPMETLETLEVVLYQGLSPIVKTTFHGAHVRGRSISYFKPTSSKTGELWSASYMDPKTKQRKFYSLYGGKLTGILTQSMCREMFVTGMVKAEEVLSEFHNVELIGQFHDELVVDWWPVEGPNNLSLLMAKTALEDAMTTVAFSADFPLEADVKSSYRYIK